MRNNLILYIGIVVLLFCSCKQKNRFYISRFDEEIEVNIHRFDIDFININTENIIGELDALENKYPAFFPLYIEEVLMMDIELYYLQNEDNQFYAKEIKHFLEDSIFIDVHKQVKTTFDQCKDLETQLSTAYSYLHHYFPELILPEVYFFVSGFNQELLVTDSLIGIGVDLYLGEDYELYHHITHEYLIPNMRKEMIATDLLKTLLYDEFMFQADANLLNSMLYEGKILYLLSVILPKSKDEMLIGYSSDELKWSKHYEKAIWSSIIEQKHLYSTDYSLINQYVNVAPFTSPITSDSPGRLGMWVGWQIIQQYMLNNKDIDLPTLMTNENYQQILEKSGYKP